MSDIRVGETYIVACPFLRQAYRRFDEDGGYVELSWRPGIKWQNIGPEDCSPVAHGWGMVEYRVIDIHKPPHPYPARVFFVRQWVDPSGRRFGHNKLRIMTVDALRRRTRSYQPAGLDNQSDLIVEDLNEEELAKLIQGAS